MDPIQINEIKELENVKMLWKLAVWVMSSVGPTFVSLIVYFYFQLQKCKDGIADDLKKDNEKYKDIFRDQIKK